MTKFADYFCEAEFLQGCECKVKKILGLSGSGIFLLPELVCYVGRQKGKMCKISDIKFFMVFRRLRGRLRLIWYLEGIAYNFK